MLSQKESITLKSPRYRIYPLLNLQQEGLGEFCSFLRKQVPYYIKWLVYTYAVSWYLGIGADLGVHGLNCLCIEGCVCKQTLLGMSHVWSTMVITADISTDSVQIEVLILHDAVSNFAHTFTY